MNTLYSRFPLAHGLTSRVATMAARWLAAVDSQVADAMERSRRNERERYLSKAADPYDLERLERQWERRRVDNWSSM